MDRISRADCTGSSAGGRIDRRVECATMSAQTENRMLERTSFAQQNTSDCIARARALAPLIAAHAEHTERAREIASDVLSALHDAQLFRMLIPKSCDGSE